MNTPHHYCPACRRDARFITNERRQRQACALCYTEFPLDWSFAAEPPSEPQSSIQWIVNVGGLILLVVLGLPALVLAIAFIGCVGLL